MNFECLDFEQPIVELEAKIKELRLVGGDSELNISEEVVNLEKKCHALTKDIFSGLTAWQVAQLARHPRRPYTLDYVTEMLSDFDEYRGDRLYADDPAIVGGVGQLDGQSVMIIGHQKGREVSDKIYRNFGMPKPEGYRKALRLGKLAERFQLPIITFIDTPGAYPGIGAEERGQSEAIATNIAQFSRLKTPIINVVLGEGGSGGALAIGVGDVLMMMQYSTYSVISPEGCASILWKKADKAPEAAAAMGITAAHLEKLGIVDRIIMEPLGGAHRNIPETSRCLKEALLEKLDSIIGLGIEDLLERRYKRIRAHGVGHYSE